MRKALSDTFWLLVLGVVVMFAFFAALGAFEVGEAVVLTVVWALMRAVPSRKVPLEGGLMMTAAKASPSASVKPKSAVLIV